MAGSKRRVTGGASPDTASPGLKRRKVSPDDDSPTTETAQSTTEAGLSLLDQIKETTDKNGRLIANDFLQLPDRKENPDYYATITLPIAIDIVEEKLRNHKYPTVTPLESDLKRMVSNAKFYNEKSSQIFADAERIRKILTSTMPKLNPAYNDPNYVPFPTPLPETRGPPQVAGGADMVKNGSVGGNQTREEKPTGTPKPLNGKTATPAAGDSGDAKYGFGNDTLQNAEDRIVNELLALKDDDDQEIAAPFITKPDQRMYKEYYDIIQHPVSLRGIQKRVRGIGWKNNPMKKTSFPTWQSFEDEMNYVWRNAREFNEDGSEIVILAGKLEEYFKKRIEEAKAVVPEPPQEDGDGSTPRLKLKMGSTKTPEPSSQKLTLKFQGQKTETPPNPERSTMGVTVDNEALKRQQELVRAGSNGQDYAQNATPSSTEPGKRSFGSPNKKSTPLAGTSQERQSSASAAVSSHAMPGIEGEGPGGPSPNLAAAQPAGESLEANKAGGVLEPGATRTPSVPNLAASTMGPPLSVTPRPSGSPLPSQPQMQSQTPQAPVVSPLDCRVRHPGKPPLIPNVSVTGYSSLGDGDNFHLDIAPLPHDPQQSLTFTLRPIHNLLTVIPTVTPSSAQRQTKLVVSVNFQKFSPVPSGLGPMDTTNPRYEIRLTEGAVTKVDIEMISGPARGTPKTGQASHDVEYERVTLFAHLMRSF